CPVRRSRTCSRHPDQRPLVTHCAGVCRMVRLARSIVVAALASFIGLAPLVFGVGIFSASAVQAADVIRVAYAGSMGAVMDRVIGPAFAKANGVEYQGIGDGSYGLARRLEGRLLQAEVFLPITPGPIDIVKKDS